MITNQLDLTPNPLWNIISLTDWNNIQWKKGFLNDQVLLLTGNNIYIIITDIEGNIYRLIHGHFHIGQVIIPRHPYWPDPQSMANIGRGIITRPIWKCPCFKLFITYFRHLEKRHPYWPETKSRPVLARTNMALDMEMIL